EEWAAQTLPPGSTLGFDPEAFSASALHALEEKLAPAGIAVQPFAGLVDTVWLDRPPTSFAPVVEHPLRFAGESATDKLQRVRRAIAEHDATAMLVTGQDEVAW